jgi:hypothetical protein
MYFSHSNISKVDYSSKSKSSNVHDFMLIKDTVRALDLNLEP